MGIMVGLLKQFFRPQPPPFDVGSGGQRIVDPLLMLNAQRFYVGLRREDRLTLFHSIHHSQPLATGAVNVLTKMCNARPLFKSGNPEVDARCKQIWAEIKGHEVNAQLMRQGLIYGYGVAEWVSEDMTRVDRVVVPDAPLVRFVADKFASITHVQQLTGTVFSPGDAKTRIPANKFIIYRRDPESSFDYYGASLFESAVEQVDAICQIMKAQIKVYMRLGTPRFHVTVDNTACTPEQYRDRLEACKKHFAGLADPSATDVFLPPGCEVKIIGAESFGQRFADETRLVIQSILAAVGIPPALLHVVTQASGGAESWVRQSVISLQSILDNIQDGMASAWNTSFWRVVEAIENMPTTPRMEFEAPRLLEMLQEEQARQAKYQNDLTEVIAGIRPPEWLAQQCGADDAYDLNALTEYVERQRSNPQENKEFGSAETNKNGQTKYTDQQASNKTTG